MSKGEISLPVIIHRIYIDAPSSLCFDLARNIDVHMETTSETGERAVGGKTEGLMEKGDTVTWEAKHLGVRQRLTAQIVEMERPTMFTDVMVKGAFQSFTHVHEFHEHDNGTIMTDTFSYRSPFGLLGVCADLLFLKRYMRRFIVQRAQELKRIAEEYKTQR